MAYNIYDNLKGIDESRIIAEWFEQDETQNTNVYVTGLPLQNYNLEKFANLMKKCGLIKPDEKTGHPKVKLYFDGDGKLKGDGLCCYLAVESVHLGKNIYIFILYRGLIKQRFL